MLKFSATVEPTGRPTDGANLQAYALGYTREQIDCWASQTVLRWEMGPEAAGTYLLSLELPPEAFTAVWSQLDSPARTAIKKFLRNL